MKKMKFLSVIGLLALVAVIVFVGCALNGGSEGSETLAPSDFSQTEASSEQTTVPTTEATTAPTTEATTLGTTAPPSTEPMTPPEDVEDGEKLVALTFDDGPSKVTSNILDILEENGARATFCILGDRVNQYPETIKRALALGCEMANHSYDHSRYSNLSAEGISSQISRTNSAIRDLTGVSPRFARVPYGENQAFVKEAVGMPMLFWSIDTEDWKHKNDSDRSGARDDIVDEILSQVRDGDIILMHDLYGLTEDVCRKVVPALIERGYKLVTVSEMFAAKGKSAENGVVYSSAR